MSRLDAITDWVEKAKLAGYNARKLAKMRAVSPSQLRRYFASVFGKSPQRWLNELRLWEAPRLVCAGKSVKEAAAQLCFATEAHFCHQFKAYHGCTPQEFARLYRQREAEGRERFVGDEYYHWMKGTPPWETAERNLCRKIGVFNQRESAIRQNARPRQ